MANDLWGASDLNLTTMVVNSPNLVLGGGFEVARSELSQLIAPASAENLNGYGGPSIHPMTGLGAPFGFNGNYSYTAGWDTTLDFYKVAVGVGDATALLPPLLLPCAIVIDNQALGDETEFILQFKQHFAVAGQYSVTFTLYGGWYRQVITYKSTDFPDGNVVLPITIPVELYNQVQNTGYDIDSAPLYHSGLTIFINGSYNASSGLTSFTHSGFPNSIGHVADVKSNYLYIKDIDFFAGSTSRVFTPATIGETRLGLRRYTRRIESKAKGLVTEHALRIPPHPEMIRRRRSTPACIESVQRPAIAPLPEAVPEIIITKQPVDNATIMTSSGSVTFTCEARSSHFNTLTYTWYNAETNATLKTEVGTSSSFECVIASDNTDISRSVYCTVHADGFPTLPPVRSLVAVVMLRNAMDVAVHTPEVVTARAPEVRPPVIQPKDVTLVQLSHTGAFSQMDFADGLSYSDAPIIYSHPPLDAYRNSDECPWVCDVKLKNKTVSGGTITVDVDFYISDLSVDLSKATFTEFGADPCWTGSHCSNPTGTFIASTISSDYLYQIITVRWVAESKSYGAGHFSCFYINYAKSSTRLTI